jgi:very-short-patch-repair endonuclease
VPCPSTPEAQIAASRYITEVTRRRLLDGLDWLRGTVPSGYREFMTPAHTFWSGALPETDFLARLYDLGELPSNDSRYKTAFQDIFQHRVMNEDWDDVWIFYDPRFGLADSDEALLQFLAEMMHPAVRTNPAEVERLHSFLNSVLVHDGYELVQVDDISGAPLFAPRRIGTGVRGNMKNLIFAAIGPKPEIVLVDAVNNDLRITGNIQGCLMYDRPLAAHGLTWAELTAWWADREGMATTPTREVSLSLYRRLDLSLGDNDAERRVLRTYASRYARLGPDIPALIPQVYLHYDPHARSHYPPGTAPLHRQRMDFLMLLPHRARVVIECDGVQHYADDQVLPSKRRYASPRRYAEMVAEDRELRLAGYEVYRFGGAELNDSPDTARRLDDFFVRLADRHSA